MKTIFVASSRRFYDIVFKIKEKLDELGIYKICFPMKQIFYGG
jgi:hypothetical protein